MKNIESVRFGVIDGVSPALVDDATASGTSCWQVCDDPSNRELAPLQNATGYSLKCPGGVPLVLGVQSASREAKAAVVTFVSTGADTQRVRFVPFFLPVNHSEEEDRDDSERAANNTNAAAVAVLQSRELALTQAAAQLQPGGDEGDDNDGAITSARRAWRSLLEKNERPDRAADYILRDVSSSHVLTVAEMRHAYPDTQTPAWLSPDRRVAAQTFGIRVSRYDFREAELVATVTGLPLMAELPDDEASTNEKAACMTHAVANLCQVRLETAKISKTQSVPLSSPSRLFDSYRCVSPLEQAQSLSAS